MRRVYVAGPMSGLPEFNYPAFFDAAKRLRALGYEVACPAEVDAGDQERDWAWYMRQDLHLLIDCDAVVTLPDWQRSRGASLEVFVAAQLGLDVLPLDAVLSPPAAQPQDAA